MSTRCSTHPIPHGVYRRALAVLSGLALLGLGTFAAQSGQARHVPGQILVKPKPGVDASQLDARLRLHGGRTRRVIPKLDVRLVSVKEADTERTLARLQGDPLVEYAERDHLAEAAITLNDPKVLDGSAWHIANIQAPDAWNSSTGSNLVVAVLDSGVNAVHPDLADRLVPGYDFVWNDADPADDLGHGTAVAGVISAAANNAIGAAGVAFNARLMPVKVMNSSGYAAYSAIAQGIRHAVDHGARVINISIAGSSPSATLQNAIDYAWSSNVVVVAAAGNNGNTTPLFPAACSNVVAVSATMPDDTLAAFSSHGNHLALAAPGNAIWTTTRDLATGYSAWSGTSLASPVVAGVAALAGAANPALSSSQIVSILKLTADDSGSAGFDPLYGHGRVNASRAVEAARQGGFAAPVANVLTPSPGVGVSGQVNVQVAATASAAIVQVECYANGVLIGRTAGTSASFAWETAALTNGTYTLHASATDAAGNVGVSAGVQVSVVNQAPEPATITSLVPAQNGGLILNWTATPNRTYRVQYATNLLAPDWQYYPGNVTATDSNASAALHLPGTPQCFFRIHSAP